MGTLGHNVGMKLGRYFLVWLLATLTLAAAEQARTWTDIQGRTLTAVFVEANAQEVTVRLASGDLAHIPRANLSADDLAYADKAQANRPITALVEVSRVTLSTSTSVAKGIQTVADQTGYNVTVTNQSALLGQDLNVEYRIFFRQGAQGKSISSQPLMNLGGSEKIPKLESRAKTSFRTNGATINRKSPAPLSANAGTNAKPNAWPNGGQETVSDEIEGVWVRVYQGDQIVGEYVSADTLRKEGWPDASGTPAKAAGKKKAAAPAPAK